MKDICVYVANHRDAEPLKEAPYQLLRVGVTSSTTNEHEGVSLDSEGESIAYKNFAYSELTGLYWIWKNTSHDITGLMHYRRFLASPGTDRPLNAQEIEAALQEHDFLVPKPAQLECSVAEHYCYCHPSTDLLALAEVMEKQPEKYRLAFSEVMGSDLIIPCNIMIAKKELLDEYCEWLFDVLGECEQKIELFSGRDAYQMRAFGFLSERLLLVWLIANDINCGFYDVITLGEAENLHEGVPGKYKYNLISGIHGVSPSQAEFDADFYINQYEDVAAAYPQELAIEHYLQHGMFEGRQPSASYSLDDYANLRPKLRQKLGEMSPAMISSLKREARLRRPKLPKHKVLGISRMGLVDYSPVYDWVFYSNEYDDVPGDYFNTREALKHFIEVGIPEGRRGSKGFSLDAYKEQHPELVEKFGDDNRRYYLHYATVDSRKEEGVDWRYVG